MQQLCGYRKTFQVLCDIKIIAIFTILLHICPTRHPRRPTSELHQGAIISQHYLDMRVDVYCERKEIIVSLTDRYKTGEIMGLAGGENVEHTN